LCCSGRFIKAIMDGVLATPPWVEFGQVAETLRRSGRNWQNYSKNSSRRKCDIGFSQTDRMRTMGRKDESKCDGGIAYRIRVDMVDGIALLARGLAYPWRGGETC
jgi:hypothetical protein